MQYHWSYDNLCQLIMLLDNLRSDLEIENMELMYRMARLCHNEEG